MCVCVCARVCVSVYPCLWVFCLFARLCSCVFSSMCACVCSCLLSYVLEYVRLCMVGCASVSVCVRVVREYVCVPL